MRLPHRDEVLRVARGGLLGIPLSVIASLEAYAAVQKKQGFRCSGKVIRFPPGSTLCPLGGQQGLDAYGNRVGNTDFCGGEQNRCSVPAHSVDVDVAPGAPGIGVGSGIGRQNIQ
jgi:hypothetical protein